MVHHRRLDIHIPEQLQQHIKVLHQCPVLQDMMVQLVLLLLHVGVLEAGQQFQDVLLKVCMYMNRAAGKKIF